jgi:glycosyltransferase involved in cell wall biosynthesis
VRVALVTNILAPYRVPVFQALARTPGWRLRVFASAASEFDRSWDVRGGGLDVELVRGPALVRRVATRGRAAAEQRVTLHLPLGLPAALARFAPDVVVSGELGPRTALALSFCALRRVPLAIWSYHSRLSASQAGALRRALWRALLARADAVIGMGAQARAVLRGLGVAEERIFDAPNAHDHEGLAKATAALDREALRAALRAAHGCRERIALVAGRLVPVKGIPQLLAAWDALPRELRGASTLLFVGDGPLAGRLRQEGAARARGEIVQLPAVQPEALARHYAAADLLAFPSLGDTWGLVANEAMACGLPVLCSRLAGCADDLVREGENGWLCDPSDPADLARALRAALSTPDLSALARRARDTAERFRPELMAAGMRRAVGSIARVAGP